MNLKRILLIAAIALGLAFFFVMQKDKLVPVASQETIATDVVPKNAEPVPNQVVPEVPVPAPRATPPPSPDRTSPYDDPANQAAVSETATAPPAIVRLKTKTAKIALDLFLEEAGLDFEPPILVYDYSFGYQNSETMTLDASSHDKSGDIVLVVQNRGTTDALINSFLTDRGINATELQPVTKPGLTYSVINNFESKILIRTGKAKNQATYLFAWITPEAPTPEQVKRFEAAIRSPQD